MEFINFQVGCKTISLKILDILLTERFDNNLTTLPNNNKSFIGLNELRTWQASLNDWFSQFEKSIAQQSHVITNDKTQLHNIAVFYKEFKTDNSDLKTIIEKLDEPFQALVTATDRAVSTHNEQDYKQASKYLASIKRNSFMQLQRLFDAAKEQITLDYKPIIVFTTKDGLNPHIGLLVDKVEDNIDRKPKA